MRQNEKDRLVIELEKEGFAIYPESKRLADFILEERNRIVLNIKTNLCVRFTDKTINSKQLHILCDDIDKLAGIGQEEV